jgi:hypothetical protein
MQHISDILGIFLEGREEGRDGGREERREGGRREGGRERKVRIEGERERMGRGLHKGPLWGRGRTRLE